MELNFNNETVEKLEDYYNVYLKIFENTLKELEKETNYICSVTFVDEDTIRD